VDEREPIKEHHFLSKKLLHEPKGIIAITASDNLCWRHLVATCFSAITAGEGRQLVKKKKNWEKLDKYWVKIVKNRGKLHKPLAPLRLSFSSKQNLLRKNELF